MREQLIAEAIAALKEAERLYATRALLANSSACGLWINRTRDVLEKLKRIPAGPTVPLMGRID